jgi:hypothetical protein
MRGGYIMSPLLMSVTAITPLFTCPLITRGRVKRGVFIRGNVTWVLIMRSCVVRVHLRRLLVKRQLIIRVRLARPLVASRVEPHLLRAEVGVLCSDPSSKGECDKTT